MLSSSRFLTKLALLALLCASLAYFGSAQTTNAGFVEDPSVYYDCYYTAACKDGNIACQANYATCCYCASNSYFASCYGCASGYDCQYVNGSYGCQASTYSPYSGNPNTAALAFVSSLLVIFVATLASLISF